MKFLVATYLFLTSLMVIAQNNDVVITVTPDNVEVGQKMVVTIASSIPGDLKLENLPVEFKRDYGTQQGQSSEVDYNTGAHKTVYYYSISGYMKKTGEYNFGPVYIKANNKTYPSNTVTVKVDKQVLMTSGEISDAQLNSPAFGVINVNKKEIYEGEPIIVAAKIYCYFQPDDIRNYFSYSPVNTVTKHPIGIQSSTVSLSEEVIRGNKVNSFTYDKSIMFPSGVGEFLINPFKINLQKNFRYLPVTSSALKINIKPLPSPTPSTFFGGVGQFELTRTIDTSKIKEGDVFKMYLTLSGSGNLQNLIEPTLQLSKGFTQYGDPVVHEGFNYGIHGATGDITFEYNIQATGSGKLTLPELTLTYFSPQQEKYIDLVAETLEVDVIPNKTFTASNKVLVEKENVNDDESQLSDTENNSNNDKGNWTNPLIITGISIPIIGALLFLLFRRKKEDDDSVNDSKENKTPDAFIAIDSKQRIDEALLLAKNNINGDNDIFYSNIDKAITLVVQEKLNIESIPNRSTISNYLNQQDTSKSETYLTIMNECDQARFGFGDSSEDKSMIYNKTQGLISSL